MELYSVHQQKKKEKNKRNKEDKNGFWVKSNRMQVNANSFNFIPIKNRAIFSDK